MLSLIFLQFQSESSIVPIWVIIPAILLVIFLLLMLISVKKREKKELNKKAKQSTDKKASNKSFVIEKNTTIKERSERNFNKTLLSSSVKENPNNSSEKDDFYEKLKDYSKRSYTICRFEIVKGSGEGVRHEITSAGAVIGRTDGQILIPSPKVSSIHSKIFYVDGSFYIQDLNSGNGTFINGEKLTSTKELFNGDTFLIGESEGFLTLL